MTLRTSEGNKFEYDSLSILTLVGEDGELNISQLEDFTDPEKHANLQGRALKTGQEIPVAQNHKVHAYKGKLSAQGVNVMQCNDFTSVLRGEGTSLGEQ